MKDLSAADEVRDITFISFTEKTLIVDAASAPALGEKIIYGQQEGEVSSRDLRTVPGKCIVVAYFDYRREAERAG